MQRVAELEREVAALRAELERANATVPAGAPSTPTRHAAGAATPPGSPGGASEVSASGATAEAFDAWARAHLVSAPEEQLTYVTSKGSMIEAALARALQHVAEEKPDRAVLSLAKSLLEMEKPDIYLKVPTLEQFLDPDRPADLERELKGLIAPLLEAARAKRRQTHDSRSDGSEDDLLGRPVTHDTQSWLEELNVKELVVSALLKPVQK